MVYYCVAFGCKNRWTPGKKDDKISFHQFPTKKRDLCKKWELALKRKDFTANNRSVICSDHFESTCYIQSGWSTKRALSPEAIPSIFTAFPQYLQPQVTKPRRVIKKHNTDTITNRKRKQQSEPTAVTNETDNNVNNAAIEPLNLSINKRGFVASNPVPQTLELHQDFHIDEEQSSSPVVANVHGTEDCAQVEPLNLSVRERDANARNKCF